MKTLPILIATLALSFTAFAQVILRPGEGGSVFTDPITSSNPGFGSLGWLSDPLKDVAWIQPTAPTAFAYIVRDTTGLVVTPMDDFVTPSGGGMNWQEGSNLPEQVWLRVYLTDDVLGAGDQVGAYALRSQRFGFDQAGVYTGEADGLRTGRHHGRHQLLVHAAGENLEDGVNGLGRRDPQAVDEAAFHAAFGEEPGHLLAAAVHDDERVEPAHGRQFPRQPEAGVVGVEERSSELYQQPQRRPSVSGYPSIKFMFWTACPAAPFTRLSMTLTTTARPVAASTFTPMSQ